MSNEKDLWSQSLGVDQKSSIGKLLQVFQAYYINNTYS